MGVVYRATDDSHAGRAVAVKFLWPRDSEAALRGYRAPTPQELRRFDRECEMHRRFGGQGVPAFVHADLSPPRPYLVTEYVDGDDLHAFLTRNRPTLSATACVVVPLLEVLGRVHGAGVVHRDVKPANVLLARRDGVVYLTDFGIALPKDPTATRYTNGRTPGTIGYMAPEIHRGERNPGPAADLYGVACIAFQMVTGRLVFEADHSDYDLARLHCEERPPLLSDDIPGLPSRIVDITDRMLAKSPADRPPLELALKVWRPLLPSLGDPGPRPALDPDPTLPHRAPDTAAASRAAAPPTGVRRPQVHRRPVGGPTRSALRSLCAEAEIEVERGEPDKAIDELTAMLVRAEQCLPGAVREVQGARLIVAHAQLLRGETAAAGRTYRDVARRLADAPAGTETGELRVRARLGAVQVMAAEGNPVQAVADLWLKLAEVLTSWPGPGPSRQTMELCRDVGVEVEELALDAGRGEVSPGLPDAIRKVLAGLPGPG
ncbi:serine/threonine protein kinase [Streptomyces sp. AV19]|nr:serine/threonine-protein kinase [Streptomyces sp. AV19]MBH1936943.1 serine/threonine protein kinase [Streptomyces sp. AV19]MDG4532998.1 serine/threonine protein kinase [Streptomyces sp. AV19]